VGSALYYGDNLYVMKEHIGDASVDLIYLDPPFNSDARYNVLFKTPEGDPSGAQAEAFHDTWHWSEQAEAAYDEMMATGGSAAEILRALRGGLGNSDMMAYLANMSVRLNEMRRVLKPTGSLYLHCDPNASHYLKIILDGIFGHENFLNEIVWRRTGSHNSTRRYGPVHDIILFYSASDKYEFNRLVRPYMKGHVQKAFLEEDGRYRTNYTGNVLTGSGKRNGISGEPWRGFDPTAKGRHWALPRKLLEGMEDEFEGLNQHQKFDKLYAKGIITIKRGDEWPAYRRYISENDGQYLSDVWAYQPYTEGAVFGTKVGIDDDVRWMGTKDDERIGYPTQKPLGLLRRIISASSNAGDTILDPFCGCGTTVHAAQELKRRWIGIDVAHYAVGVIDDRLKQEFGKNIDFSVMGRPTEMEGARELARRDKYQFQWWANWLVGVQNYREHRKGADRGIDGIIYFRNGPFGTGRIIVSVKGGDAVSPEMVRALAGTVDREKAELGLFVSLAQPSARMKQEAAAIGIRKTAHGKFPKVQIVTIEELLARKRLNLPPRYEVRPGEIIGKPARNREPDPQLGFTFGIRGEKSSKSVIYPAERYVGRLMNAG
jgi:adenine specific DNA methylase Mod